MRPDDATNPQPGEDASLEAPETRAFTAESTRPEIEVDAAATRFDPTEPPPAPPTTPDFASSEDDRTFREPAPPSEALQEADRETVPETRMSADDASARPDVFGSWGTLPVDGRLEAGQVVFGRYLVKQRLGRGGMGTVWLVRHLTLDSDRALKTIMANIAFDPQARGRFRREAQAMARFTHPNAVTVHDALLTDDIAFIEMEYVRGESLDRTLEPGKPMPLDWTARIAVQLCEVLQVAHESGIVHRDLKPSNLMLVEGRPEGREHLKVLDFGIAKILGRDEPDAEVHTVTGSFMGTPPYSSPEQADGRAVDARSDVYSVGVILYEFLTGHRPFSGPVGRQIAATIHTPPPPFTKVNPEARVPAAVEAVVLRCLEKSPDNRPQSARDLASEFLAALPHEIRASAASEPTSSPSQPSTVSPARPNRLLLGAIAAGSILLLGSVLALSGAFSGRTSSGSGTDPSKANHPASRVGPGNIDSKPAESAPQPPPGFAFDPSAPGGEILIHKADGARFIKLRGGTFTMGGLAPKGARTIPKEHEVKVADFYLGTTEVTNGRMRRYFESAGVTAPRVWQEAYDALLKNGLKADEADRHPAVGIPHEMAADFAAHEGFRLPTEAEWEYAARSRGAKGAVYVWEGDAELVPNSGNANVDTVDSLPNRTSTVGNFNTDRTRQGVFDLMGNVREWCADQVPGAGLPRFVVRGGSWHSNASLVGTTMREELAGTESLDDLGFRLALDPPRTKPAPR